MNYPKNLQEFENAFATEQQCRDYLFQLKWEESFVCPKCSHNKTWLIADLRHKCCKCGYRFSIIAGTIFQDTHKPLTLWFRAIWYLTAQKNGASALGIQQILGLGSYRTAWTWLHKLRRAMIRPGRDKLQGVIEVDETYVGAAKQGGKRGRGAGNKVLVAVAVEITNKKIGRIRMAVIDDASSDSLHNFVEQTIEKGSTIVTDGWNGYNGLSQKGYQQETKNQKDDQTLLPHVHTVISLLKRWLLGTLQGSCSKDHFAYYLDEYTFRFNRRKSKSRGMLFYRLLQNAVQVEPSTYKDIISQ
jgi:transposase-like protein